TSQDHGVGIPVLLPLAVHYPASRAGFQSLHRRSEHYVKSYAQRFDQQPQPVAERPQPARPLASRFAPPLFGRRDQALEHAAMLLLQRGETRKGGADAEQLWIAGVDARDKGINQYVRDLCSRAAACEGINGLVIGDR